MQSRNRVDIFYKYVDKVISEIPCLVSELPVLIEISRKNPAKNGGV